MQDSKIMPEPEVLLDLMQRLMHNSSISSLFSVKSANLCYIKQTLDYILDNKLFEMQNEVPVITRKGGVFFDNLCKHLHKKGLYKYLSVNTDILREPNEIRAPYLPLKYRKG